MIRQFSASVLLFSLSISTIMAQPYLLPDGSTLKVWDDETIYDKEYHVSQNHPNASDKNPGTFESPFKTIDKAAQVLKPGEKVLIHSGIYREQVQPARGGASSEEMIAYEAAPGAKVVVQGSLPFREEWTISDTVLGFEYSHNVWQAALDKAKFKPFYVVNADQGAMELMHWATERAGSVPFSLFRGVVFQEGRRLTQMADYEDLLNIEGTFWVDTARQMIHLHPYGNVDPNEVQFEFTNRQQLLVPREMGLGYIRISGIHFRHAGNGLPRVGTGAVFVRGGHHWIIENCRVDQVNSVGIETGARVHESRVASEEEKAMVEKHEGGFIVRNNEVYDCGTGGIQGHTVRNALYENNHIHHIGWQNMERYWECAGVKLLKNTNTVVASNLVHDINEASGLWLDWDNKNSRITSNVIYNIGGTYNGAIFTEASIVPNMIDNNFIWNVRGPGISLYDTDLAIVAHNVIVGATVPISSRINTDRSLDGRPLTSKENKILYNVYYQNEALPVIESNANESNYNVFMGRDNAEALTNRGLEQNSVFSEDMKMEWDPGLLELTVYTNEPWPVFPEASLLKFDMWGNQRMEKSAAPGFWQTSFKEKMVFELK